MPNDTTIPPLLLTRAQAAAALALSIDMLDVLIRRGDFPAVRIGRAVRLDRRDIEAWIDRQKAPALEVAR